MLFRVRVTVIFFPKFPFLFILNGLKLCSTLNRTSNRTLSIELRPVWSLRTLIAIKFIGGKLYLKLMGHFSVYNELKLRVTISPSLKSWKKTKTEPLCSIRTSYSFHSRVTCHIIWRSVKDKRSRWHLSLNLTFSSTLPRNNNSITQSDKLLKCNFEIDKLCSET